MFKFDKTLVENLKKHDEKAFDIVFREFSKPLVAFIYTYVKNTEDAKDIAQDIFLKLFIIAEKYDTSKGTFQTWLLSISKNETLNFIKAKRDLISFDEETLEVYTRKTEKLFSIHDLVNCLNPMEYRVNILKYCNDMKIYEIAELLSVSESTIKRALRSSATKIREYCEENKVHE